MRFENDEGVFRVRYSDAAALAPERQAALVAALTEASGREPVSIVFVVPPSVRLVAHDVPQHWIRVTGDPALRIAAIAVVTSSPAVSVATRALGTASILRNDGMAVKPFGEERDAVAWARAELLRARAARRPDRPA